MGGSITINAQTSVFELAGVNVDHIGNLTAADFEKAIKRLSRELNKAKKREKKEAERWAAEERRLREQEECEAREAHAAEVTSMDLPMDWENAFYGDVRAAEVHAENISDGLVLSLANLGKVDIEYIAAIADSDPRTVIQTLRGSLYQNPDTWDECFYKGWETAEEYLSGHLMPKWKAAKEANKKYSGYFEANVRALEKAMPEPVASEDIYVTLGSPWVPADIIDDFIEHLFGRVSEWFYWDMKDEAYREKIHSFDIDIGKTITLRDLACTRHDEITGTWEIPEKGRYHHSVSVTETYGTQRIEALQILERTLNLQAVTVTDEATSYTNVSGKKRVVNQSETATAREKQKRLVSEFQHWVWSDFQRAERLQIIFEDKYGCVRGRRFDGQFLTFPTMSPTAALYPYQKDAVARILFAPNTLLAHDVGSGKTYEMVAAGMELKRMGLSTKNLYVVPNNIVGQWRDVFLGLYPQANLLIVEPRTFRPNKREAVLENLRDNSYDGIIMAYSCFEQIPLSKDCYIAELEAKKQTILAATGNSSKVTSRLKKKEEKIQQTLDELDKCLDDLYDGVYFDELGITRLFVDEAHNFKNVPLETKMRNVMGISSKGTKRCQDMLDKLRCVQRNNNGGGVVLATGTPIANSIAEVFVIQQYLQPGELAMLDLQCFDSWVGMFAEQATEFEIGADALSFRMATRFSKFHNLPELTSLLASVADFHQVDSRAGVPSEKTIDALIGKTIDFESFLEDISRRADLVHNGGVGRRADNMLKITSDGRKAALDMRLVDSAAAFSCQSKVARCAENAFDIYMKTGVKRLTQLVFCDVSTPKDGFNLYDELKDILVSMGVNQDEIAFVHDAKTEQERSELFACVRAGDVRILVGSTFKLGLGVNVQDRLIALHHLDVPWRPADMKQREGRILRRGNMNPKVKIFRYVTEGSFDAYSWQLLETKQRFISELLSGSLEERNGADLDDAVLDYAEVKALAVGNPLVKKRVEAANELARYRALQRKVAEGRQRMEQELISLPGKMAHLGDLIAFAREDGIFAQSSKAERINPDDPDGRKQRLSIRQMIGRELANNKFACKERQLMVYRGFEVVLPANMDPLQPYLWVKHSGKWRVELGDVEAGYLIRLDNCIDGFARREKEFKNGLAKMGERKRAIEQELAKNESYAEQVVEWQEILRNLDEKLEAGKK